MKKQKFVESKNLCANEFKKKENSIYVDINIIKPSNKKLANTKKSKLLFKLDGSFNYIKVNYWINQLKVFNLFSKLFVLNYRFLRNKKNVWEKCYFECSQKMA